MRLPPALGTSSKDMELLVGAQSRPGEGPKAGAPLLCGQAGRAGGAQPGEDGAPRTPCYGFSIRKGGL